ncbi:TPR-like protein [Fomitiporia mediterranea MF3/22]|uniref:TPR-like protein n=1 Tax=Fomitiporia mediterranea (strain MF3/22) TaxID=694068 RepID=UPI0004408615|nr:TPR-like protein [Fomitiporia mediterranea MF3/22]EJD02896.1 TPR-like protein [Fomitiporia mediterranea MF3/22]
MSLSNLAHSLCTRFQQNGRPEELTEAIELRRAILECHPEGHPDRAMSLTNFALSLHTRFQQRGRSEDLDKAIELNQAALDLYPEGHPDRSMSLNNLANSLSTRFERCGNVEELEEAIKLYRAALALCTEGHPLRPSIQSNLANSLHTRFEKRGQIEDLDSAIELYRASLELRSKDHPGRSSSLNSLALSLHARFQYLGTPENLEEAITLHRAALALRPKGHPDRSASLSNLADSLHTRFQQHGRTEDLDKAVELQRTALELRPEGDSSRSLYINNLANSLHTRFEQNGMREDIEQAIELHRAALVLRPDGHPDRAMSLSNLADCLRTQFKQYGGAEKLEEAIKLDRAALQLFPEGHHDRSTSLSNMAYSLQMQFEQYGKAEDHDEAIELYRAALRLRPEGHTDRAMSLNNLANSLHARFERQGQAGDLEEAINMHRAALELRPQGHPDRSMSLNNLANSLIDRFDQNGNAEDLDEAIELHQAALELRPGGHPLRSMSLSNLAANLRARFVQYGKAEDIDNSIKLHQAALELRPVGHPLCSMSLNNLADSLVTRSSRFGGTDMLEIAIKFNRVALMLRPEGHPLRSLSLKNLANSLYVRLEQQWRMDEFEECMQLLELAATHRFSGLLERLPAAHRWAELAREHEHDTTFAAYKMTLSLLQRALTISPTLHGQYDFLLRRSDYKMLTLEAASYAIEKNKLEEAIEILEQGRGLLWSQLRGLRTPLDQLADTNEELTSRFRDISLRLENLVASHEAIVSGSAMNKERKSLDELLRLKQLLSTKQEDVINEIRQVPGFERFLEATPFNVLQQAASDGPVIIVNHCRHRSDALIVLSDDASPVECVPLDEEFYQDSIKLCNELLVTRRRRGADSPEYDKKLREAMKMLWVRVVSKVDVKLKEHGIYEGSRIWWCPTSILSVLPFHAAGPFEDTYLTTRYFLDEYVSSYTPTLGALINARSDGREDEPTVLVIGDTSLHSAKQEISNIRNCGLITKLLVKKYSPPRRTVIKALREATWIHFVCHGHLDSKPFNSSFNLSDHGLTLLDIIQANIPNAEFAFLSACHTAEQPHDGAHDEVLHLAAAMQFSGFRSVIGSMWELLDDDGPAFAKTVYEYMNNCEEGEAKYKRAAGGLRKAALELKARNGISVERWVNLVHIGA